MSEPLRILVVYDHPLDHPDYYVLLWWTVERGGQPQPEPKAELFLELDKAHAYIAQEWPHLVKLMPAPGDDPKILETWI